MSSPRRHGEHGETLLRANDLPGSVIGAAIEVHSALGAGLLDRHTKNVCVMSCRYGDCRSNAKFIFRFLIKEDISIAPTASIS